MCPLDRSREEPVTASLKAPASGCYLSKKAICSSEEMQAALAWVPGGCVAWGDGHMVLVSDSLLLC